MTAGFIVVIIAVVCCGFMLGVIFGAMVGSGGKEDEYKRGYRTALVDIDAAAEATGMFFFPDIALAPDEVDMFRRAAGATYDAESAEYNGDSDDD